MNDLAKAIADRIGGPEGAERLKGTFYLIQILVGGVFVAILWRLKPGAAKNSGFAVREADLRKGRPAPGAQGGKSSGPDLANAKIERSRPLQLEGIRTSGPPHEILGVPVGATEEQIQKAYRERMKQYHPDRVGRPGTREWTDAQKIAEAINRAKDELLKRARGSR